MTIRKTSKPCIGGATPRFLAIKLDEDSFVALKNAAVVAIGSAPERLHLALSLVGMPVFRVAATDVVELLGEINDSHGMPPVSGESGERCRAV